MQDGPVLGFIGNGPRIIAFDAHIDTVGVGNRSNWTFDPYEGYEDAETIGGRGASDQEGGMASMVYAGKIIKELGLCPKDCTIVMVGTVQEEDCDGLCWQYIINEDGLKPEFVVSTEPTDGGIYRGQRGRMEIRVDVSGVSCHGSAPERGDNAIYRMAHIMTELEQLNARLADDPFLGKGTLTVSQIFYTSPSRCAVADSCAISVDRRLTFGEDKDLAISQIENLPSVKAAGDKAKVSMYTYEVPSWTGLVYPTDCYFPTWVLPEDHVVTKSTEETYRSLFGREPAPTSGPSPPTACPSWAATGSRSSASAPARKGSPPPTKRRGNRISSVRGPVRSLASNLRRQLQLNTGNSLRASSPPVKVLRR
ncbi:MAG: YgeY family selenium metabolism-linked hydrolase [Bilophila wadsworthia]